jgi:hypothetical protein
LYARYHSNLSVSVFIASACAMSLVCARALKETYRVGLATHSAPAVA